jgi:hypothetical protein
VSNISYFANYGLISEVLSKEISLECLTKCLCIQAAYFPPGCVVGRKTVLDVALATPAAILALPPCRNEKTLTFDATIHFVRSSYSALGQS